MKSILFVVLCFLYVLNAQWVNISYTGNPVHPWHRSENSLGQFSGGWYIFGGFGGDHVVDCFWNYTVSDNTYNRYTAYAYTEGGPSPRYGHRAQYSQKLNKFLVFGGKDDFYYDQLYSYDFSSAKWKNDSPRNGPGKRAFHTFNSLPDGNLVLFGGEQFNNVYGDTWIYNPVSNVWNQISPSSSPSPRYSHCDATYNGGLILFGGSNGKQLFGDVWLFQNNTWVNVIQSNGPSPRKGFSCAASSSGNFVVFGGDNNNQVFDDLWVFNVNTKTWKNLPSTSKPSSRTNLGYSAYVNNKFYIFGGSPTVAYENNVLNDVWSYSF